MLRPTRRRRGGMYVGKDPPQRGGFFEARAGGGRSCCLSPGRPAAGRGHSRVSLRGAALASRCSGEDLEDAPRARPRPGVPHTRAPRKPASTAAGRGPKPDGAHSPGAQGSQPLADGSVPRPIAGPPEPAVLAEDPLRPPIGSSIAWSRGSDSSGHARLPGRVGRVDPGRGLAGLGRAPDAR